MPPPDAFASYRHYLDHIQPVWDALASKGTLYTGPQLGGNITRALGHGPPVIVAGFPDITRTRHRPHILIEHGVGETWGESDPHYAGGMGRESVILFLCPNLRVWEANESRYPGRSVVVGSARLDRLGAIQRSEKRDDRLRVVVSFHWDNRTWGNTRSAISHFEQHLRGWNDPRIHLAGHAHPRHIDYAERVFARAGIETIRTFDEVVAWADVYAADNSSTLFEAAALGISIVYLDAPWYSYGDGSYRFDKYRDLAPRVTGGELVDVILAHDDVSYQRMVTEVFGIVDGTSARRAARAIEQVTNDTGTEGRTSGPASRSEPTQPTLFGIG